MNLKFTKVNFNKIFLLFLFFAFFILNFVVLTKSNWFDYNSEGELGIFSSHLVENGNFKKEAPNIEGVNNSYFLPDGVGYKNGFFVPKVTYGTIVIGSFGLIFGKQGLFIIFGIINLLGGFFLYNFSREFYGKKIALISIIFYLFSYPLVMWSNTLFANIIAFSFFIAGLYYVTNFLRKSKTHLGIFILGTIFLVASIWIRYEYLIYSTILFIVYFHVYSRLRKIKLLIILFLVGIVTLLLPLLILNKQTYGNALTIGYLTQEGETLSKVESSQASSSGIEENIEKIFTRFPLVRNPAKSMGIVGGATWILRNFYLFCFRVHPVANFLALITIIIILTKKRYLYPGVKALFLCSLFAIYFEGSAYHWGWEQGSYNSFYSRYWIIPFATISILGSLSFRFIKNLNKRKFLIVTFISAFFLHSFFLLHTSGSNISVMAEVRGSRYNLYHFVKDLKGPKIVVTDVLSKVFPDMEVLQPMNIEDFGYYKSMFGQSIQPQSKDYDKLNYLLEKLDKEGYEIYLVEWPEHNKTYFNIAGNLDNSRLIISEIDYDSLLGVRIYKIRCK